MTGEPTKLLISICNVAADPRPSCLLEMDTLTGHMGWVDVGLGHRPLASGVGIFADDDFVYHLSILDADFATYLSVLDRETLAVVHSQRLDEVGDGHSLVRRGDDLFVASTGTDEIVGYEMEGVVATGARTVWTPTGSGTDTHHINSLALVDGDLVCSAFGAKAGESWATATSGYIHNVTHDTTMTRELRQPHTVSWHGGQLYFCNSQLGTLNCRDEVVAHLSGYSRGLAFGPDGTTYAGTSVGRRPKGDAAGDGVFGNLGDPGEVHGWCSVVAISPGGLRTEIGLSPLGEEIYDLLVL